MKPVTVCITSCNRFDLLSRTLDSFLQLNTYPIQEILITEDSGNQDMKKKILDAYGDIVELIFNENNLGAYTSIDNMYSKVKTEYLFHIEDDWLFETNNKMIVQSMNILEERKDIHQVWVRPRSEIGVFIEDKVETTSKNVQYSMVKLNHCGGWCGFSLNPGLRRLSDYKKMFPKGYSEFAVDKTEWQALTELHCNNHAAAQGYRAAMLENTTVTHIGHGRTNY